MASAALATLLAPQINFPTDFNTNFLMLVRWIHFLAGITWIGLLYFFNLVNVPLMKELDSTTKGKVMPAYDPRPVVVPHVGGADRARRPGLLGKHRRRRRPERRWLQRVRDGKLLSNLDNRLGRALRLPHPRQGHLRQRRDSSAWFMPWWSRPRHGSS